MAQNKKLLTKIEKLLSKQKAMDLVTINLDGIADFADFAVVVTGTSSRHISSMAETLYIELKEDGILCSKEGEDTGEWVVLDAGDVVVHLFRQEIRERYNIEELYSDIDKLRAELRSEKDTLKPKVKKPLSKKETAKKVAVKKEKATKVADKKPVAKKTTIKKVAVKKEIVKKEAVKKVVKS